MNTYTFPNVKNIYLLESHPCDLVVFRRFYYTNTKIYLSEGYSRYKNKWTEGYDNVIILNSNQMTELINIYIDKDIITSDRE